MLIPENYFIFINVLIVAIYLVFMFIGYKKGFLYEVVNLIYTALSLVIAWFVSPVLASLFPIVDLNNISSEYKILGELFNLNTILNTVLYFIIVFLLLKLIYVIISILLKSMNEIPVVGSFNKILGAVFGFFNATLIVLALSMLCSLPIIKNGNDIKEKTFMKFVNTYSDMALDFVVEKISYMHIKEGITDFDVETYRNQLKEWIINLNKNG